MRAAFTLRFLAERLRLRQVAVPDVATGEASEVVVATTGVEEGEEAGLTMPTTAEDVGEAAWVEELVLDEVLEDVLVAEDEDLEALDPELEPVEIKLATEPPGKT